MGNFVTLQEPQKRLYRKSFFLSNLELPFASVQLDTIHSAPDYGLEARCGVAAWTALASVWLCPKESVDIGAFSLTTAFLTVSLRHFSTALLFP